MGREQVARDSCFSAEQVESKHRSVNVPVIGTPLGVCVNCAAPIARGMYTSGLRAETTLSADLDVQARSERVLSSKYFLKV